LLVLLTLLSEGVQAQTDKCGDWKWALYHDCPGPHGCCSPQIGILSASEQQKEGRTILGTYRTEQQALSAACGMLSNVTWVNAPSGICNGPKGDLGGDRYGIEAIADVDIMTHEYTCRQAQPDDDQDGVPNSRDSCKGTSSGTPVDRSGCACLEEGGGAGSKSAGDDSGDSGVSGEPPPGDDDVPGSISQEDEGGGRGLDVVRAIEELLGGKNARAPSPAEAAAGGGAAALGTGVLIFIQRWLNEWLGPSGNGRLPGNDLDRLLQGHSGSTLNSAMRIALAGRGGSFPRAWRYFWKADFSKALREWYKIAEGTKITDAHRLPKRIQEGGLYGTTRKPLIQAIKQIHIKSGHPREWAEEVAKLMEARGGQADRIARLSIEALRLVRAGAQGGAHAEVGRPGAGAAAAVWDFAPPDPVRFVERLVLTQKSNYLDAVQRWRNTQTVGRWASTNPLSRDPTTTQEVDKLLRDLRAEQRAVKRSLGNDMTRMRDDATMRALWAEETALKRLRQHVADMNLIRRRTRR
jgi:hypothetical protein